MTCVRLTHTLEFRGLIAGIILAKLLGMKISVRYTIAILVLIGASASAFALSAKDPRHDAVVARAERIFDFDNRHPDTLSAPLVRALSIAVRFHNDKGAEEIIAKLERATN